MATAVAAVGLSELDQTRQLTLVRAYADRDLAHAYANGTQTSGPGLAYFATPVFVVVRVFTSELTAFKVACVACLLPLVGATVAAARASGIAARTGRELLAVGAVVLGVPVLACYVEAFHPADVLATAACLGAFAAIARSRWLLGAALLGYAIATRQWALVALMVAVALAEPPARLRFAGAALGTTVAVTIPVAIAATTGTIEAYAAKGVSRYALTAPGLVDLPQSGQYLLSRYLPLIAVGAFCVALAERNIRFGPEVALAAFAVALSIRPLIDPAGYLYYLCPAYAFWVMMRPRSLRYPLLGLAGGAVLFLRRELADTYPAVVGMVESQGGEIRLVGALLAIATTAMLAAALLAAGAEVRRAAGIERSRRADQP